MTSMMKRATAVLIASTLFSIPALAQEAATGAGASFPAPLYSKWASDFNKATGAGGVHVDNFTFHGQTADPTTLPGFPAAWKPYFGPGRGGVEASAQVPADPACGGSSALFAPFAGLL